MHDFYLIKKSETQDEDFFQYFWRDKDDYEDLIVEYIGLEDKIVEYIYDSLTWIPCMNPAFPENPKQVGFNNIGITLFDEHSADSLISIFSSWRDLLKNGPNEILKMIYYHDYSEDELVRFDRDFAIAKFEKFISISKQLSEGNYYISLWYMKIKEPSQTPVWEGSTSINAGSYYIKKTKYLLNIYEWGVKMSNDTNKSNVGHTIFKSTGVYHKYPFIDLVKNK